MTAQRPLRPRRLNSQNTDVRYTFAEPYKCCCLHVGGPKECTAYQELVTEKQIAQERHRQGRSAPPPAPRPPREQRRA